MHTKSLRKVLFILCFFVKQLDSMWILGLAAMVSVQRLQRLGERGFSVILLSLLDYGVSGT